ncbi:unnamed protein product [Vicia faba]|uniref:Protein arginine N-methyltransferase 2 n=1 Tax=Vicia faba TaxID=3906 RepID=A0AAV0ZP28_VICFA|nr:unnamed protein product [Vicia faba]
MKEQELCEAAIKGETETVTGLIDSGADVTYFDGGGITPLMHAAKHGHAPILNLLLSAGAPWNALSPSNLSAGDFAMQEGHQEAYELLLNAGIRSELVLGTIARKEKKNTDSGYDYLEDRVSFSEGGGHVLNIGFGMGLFDTAIQQYSPVKHTIVEAHPEVYERMLRDGWGEKENVRIIFGRWQDVLPQLETYDGIFFDTYGEYYEDLREFHQHLPVLLKPDGVYSFFNGLCGGNAFFHVVYCHLVSLELENLGYSTQLIPLPVKDCLGEQVWEGVKHRYWQLDTYYLPVCQSAENSE